MKHIHESIIGRKGSGYQKYELTDEPVKIGGKILYHIKALNDIPSKGVKKGDLGGWVESYDNLDQTGNCWVGGAAIVFGNAKVCGDAEVYDEAWIFGSAKVYGNAIVHDSARIYGDAQIYDDAEVYGSALVYDNAHVHGKSKVCGYAEVYGTAKVDYNMNRGSVKK